MLLLLKEVNDLFIVAYIHYCTWSYGGREPANVRAQGDFSFSQEGYSLMCWNHHLLTCSRDCFLKVKISQNPKKKKKNCLPQNLNHILQAFGFFVAKWLLLLALLIDGWIICNEKIQKILSVQVNNFFFLYMYVPVKGVPGSASGKEPGCQCRRHNRCRFAPWVRNIPWNRAW